MLIALDCGKASPHLGLTERAVFNHFTARTDYVSQWRQF